MRSVTIVILVLEVYKVFESCHGALTDKQMNDTLETMRKACVPKFKIDEENLNAMRAGKFKPDPDKEIKCYTRCIAQMAGTLTKKGEVSFSKTMAQIEALLPTAMKAPAKEALQACKNIQNDHKESCDKVYYSVKCAAEFNPAIFRFP
ncbi:general odorant-binding protein lush-like [Uranotaenia lowii]|uniref:general odorant-binding protein lush-like n=1 Tax=Uranotaenia lowii TaxID=190385 RepID=UPI002479D259|nr:general odorant-binding protein lush-like [Uranotaenia lowii]